MPKFPALPAFALLFAWGACAAQTPERAPSPFPKVSEAGLLDMGPGAVTWRVCPVGSTYQAAPDHCSGHPVKQTWIQAVKLVELMNQQNFEGHNDWRLPARADFALLLRRDPRVSKLYEKILPFAMSTSTFGTVPNECEHVFLAYRAVFARYAYSVNTWYESLHWIADNRNPQTGQSPLAVNDHSEGSGRSACNHTFTIFGDNPRSEVVRAHTPLPFRVVRGGTPENAWEQARKLIPMSVSIDLESRAQARGAAQAMNEVLGRATQFAKDLMAAGGPGTAATPPGGHRVLGDSVNASGRREVWGYCSDGTSFGGTKWPADDYWTMVGKRATQEGRLSLEGAIAKVCAN